MPPIKLSEVLECSNEDVDNGLEAKNLLFNEGYKKKWKTKEWVKSAFIVFKLSEPTKISSVEIGNEGSAFVEVLVADSRQSPIKYQVLLSMSSFMTPTESQQMSNLNRVRLFSGEKLAEITAKQKWDLVKVVCAQQFNKTVSFGLTFINLTASEEDDDVDTSPTVQFGAFKLKPDNDDTTTLSRMLRKRDVQPDPMSLTAALKKNDTKDQPSTTMAKTPKPLKQVKQKTSTKKLTQQKPPLASSSKKNDDPKAKKVKKQVPFDRVMRKVVFVLSGYVNPRRAELRDKCLEMGGRYRKDWDNTCTHLVCAFINTPKYKEVLQRGGGKIVRDSWVDDCHRRRRLLPWRDYKLGNYTSPAESEESEEEEENQEPVAQNSGVTYKDVDEDMPIDEDDEIANKSTQELLSQMTAKKENSISNDGATNLDDDDDDDDPIYEMETDPGEESMESDASESLLS